MSEKKIIVSFVGDNKAISKHLLRLKLMDMIIVENAKLDQIGLGSLSSIKDLISLECDTLTIKDFIKEEESLALFRKGVKRGKYL